MGLLTAAAAAPIVRAEPLLLLHQIACGAIAAAGFGVLFNVGLRSLHWCAAAGALALAVRTLCLESGWNLEGASFAAALTVGFAVRALRSITGISQGVLSVTGCIPIVPGSFAAKAILGLFAVAQQTTDDAGATLITAVQFSLRVVFTIGAIGTGLAIPSLLMRVRIGSRSGN
jgi:uncharacterized membrane protein YjjB (DUF3815 family)